MLRIFFSIKSCTYHYDRGLLCSVLWTPYFYVRCDDVAEDLRKKKSRVIALLLEKKKKIFLLFVLRKFAFRFEDYNLTFEESKW